MQVRRISQLVLKREHEYIDTVGVGCVETPAKVRIRCVLVPLLFRSSIIYVPATGFRFIERFLEMMFLEMMGSVLVYLERKGTKI